MREERRDLKESSSKPTPKLAPKQGLKRWLSQKETHSVLPWGIGLGVVSTGLLSLTLLAENSNTQPPAPPP